MKKLLVILLTLALVAGLVACGAKQEVAPQQPEVKEVEWPQFISMGTASNGGAAYIVGNIICQMLSDNAPTTATGQVTTGGGQSIAMMRTGEYELAMSDSNTVYQALESRGTFEGQEPYNDLRAICMLYTQYWEQMVACDSGVKSIRELPGKTCVVGGPGSGTESTTRTVYTAHGVDIDKDISPEFVGYAAGVELMQNRQASAMSGICPIPFSTFNELAVSGIAEIISLDEDAIDKLVAENPAMSRDIVPAGTYPNQTEDANTVSFPYLLLADASLDEDLVFEITKLIYEQTEYLRAQSSTLAKLDIVETLSSIDGLSKVQLHPGAEAFYKSIGVR